MSALSSQGAVFREVVLGSAWNRSRGVEELSEMGLSGWALLTQVSV